jgi:hypothetical protein
LRGAEGNVEFLLWARAHAVTASAIGDWADAAVREAEV